MVFHRKNMPLSHPAPLIRKLVKALVFAGAAVFLSASAGASPTVTIVAPKAGTSAGSPVFYEAFATSATCANGIAAIRIYTANGVSPYTVKGSHVQTFIKLAPGTYNTVVQAW